MRRLVGGWSLLLGVWAASACRGEFDAGPCTPGTEACECAESNACLSGLVCISDVCVTDPAGEGSGTEASSEASSSDVTSAEAEASSESEDSGPVGEPYAPCEIDADCRSDESCHDVTGGPQFTGARTCRADCTNDGDCPVGSDAGYVPFCLTTPSLESAQTNLCFVPCVDSGDCKQGEACHRDSELSWCEGATDAGVQPDTGMYAHCQASSQCATGQVCAGLSANLLPTTDGFCTETCASASDCTAGPQGTGAPGCREWGGLGTVCALPCGQSSTCPAGMACWAADAQFNCI